MVSVNQYGNSRAVPPMLLTVSKGGMSPKGTFWFFAVVTIIGGVWAWFFIPETSGRSLESMDALFKLPWYKIGRYGQADAETHEREASERALEEKATSAGVTQVEEVKGPEGHNRV
jgi:hypothetical protein